MQSAQSQGRPAPGPMAKAGDTRFWVYPAIVAVLLLVGLNLTDMGSETGNSGSVTATEEPTAKEQPVFDGRGKWTGYAR